MAFGFITAFWLVMNVLLWRAEYGGGRETVSEVPVEMVARKVLTSADRSTLTIQHQGQRMGQFQWVPSILEEGQDGRGGVTFEPEGMVRKASGYLLESDLSLVGEEPSSRWRVVTRVELETNLVWRSIDIKVIQRPRSWQFRVKAGDDAVHVRSEAGRTVSEQVFTAADLRQWAGMMGPLKGFLPPGFDLAHPSLSMTSVPGSAVRWTAGDDWFRVGRQRIRAYSVHARLLDRFDVTIFVSRAGELLKISLPDHYELTNEAVSPLEHP